MLLGGIHVVVGDRVGANRQREAERGFLRLGEQRACFEVPNCLQPRSIDAVFRAVVKRMGRAISAPAARLAILTISHL